MTGDASLTTNRASKDKFPLYPVPLESATRMNNVPDGFALGEKGGGSTTPPTLPYRAPLIYIVRMSTRTR